MLPKAQISAVRQSILKPEAISAPVKTGDAVGSVSYTVEGRVIGQISLTAAENVEKIGFFEILGRVLARFLLV